MFRNVFAILLAVLVLSGCASPTPVSAPAAVATVANPANTATPLPQVTATPTAVPAVLVEAKPTQSAPTPVAVGTGNPNDVCENPYYPVVNGAWWKYDVSTGSQPTHSITVGADKVFTIQVQDKTDTFRIKGLCTDEGIILVDAPGVSVTYSSSDGGSTLVTDNVDGLTLPSDIQVGDDWTQVIKVTGSSGGEVTLSATIETTYTAVGFEVVKVPAGLFNALKVKQVGSMSIGPGKPFETNGFIWYAQGVGVVKAGLDGIYTSELAAYNIP